MGRRVAADGARERNKKQIGTRSPKAFAYFSPNKTELNFPGGRLPCGYLSGHRRRRSVWSPARPVDLASKRENTPTTASAAIRSASRATFSCQQEEGVDQQEAVIRVGLQKMAAVFITAAKIVEIQHSLPGSMVCPGADAGAAKDKQFFHFRRGYQKGVQVVVEFVLCLVMAGY
ncbi:hypothetical protein SprV_0401612200 [Sparganum proliferum]